MQRPFVVAGIAWGTGIWLAGVTGNHPGLYLGLFVSFLLAGICYDYFFREGRAGWIFLAALFLAAAHFSWVNERNQSQIPDRLEGKELTAEGTIVSLPVVDGDLVRFQMKLDRLYQDNQVFNLHKEKIQVFLYLQSEEEVVSARKLRRYSLIRLPVKLEKPSARLNPGGMDYREYLFRQHIHWIGKGKHLDRFVVLQKAPAHPLVVVDQWKEKLSFQLEKMYDEPVSGYLRGLLLGERLEVDPDWERQYTTLGIVHLLSISGLHVTVLTGTIYFILKWFGLTREWAAWVVIGLLPVYAVLTGLHAPVVRATIMAGLTMFALIFLKPGDSLSFLGVAFLIQLGVNPYQLFEAGFQLSFLLTAGLIVWTEPVARLFSLIPSFLRYPVAGNLVAEWLSFPVVIYHFHEYSLLSWPANLLFVPVISFFVLPSALFILCLGWIWESMALFFASILETIIRMIQEWVEWFSALTEFHLSFSSPPKWWIVLYYLFSMMLLLSWLKRGSKAIRAVSLALVALLFLIYPGKSGFSARIAFLDVGQGDATVIETKNGQTILVDGGGNVRYDKDEAWQKRKNSFQVGRDVIVPYLKSQGIRKIDCLIITHGDMDHINGLLDVIRRFPVEKVVRNPGYSINGEEQKIIMELKKRNVPVYVAPTGYTWEFEEGIGMTFLHPDPTGTEKGGEPDNESSVVSLLSVGGTNLLFPGDIGTSTENRLLKRWSWPAVDILKVGHHGSASSTHETWLDVLRPKYAVISAGRFNPYGHPAPEVISRLKEREISIWRTDQHGAVIFEIGKKGIRVRPTIEPKP